MDYPYWFADPDTDIPGDWWQPVLARSADDLTSIDVFCPTKESCLDWIRDLVAVQRIDES
jgi:hypothetical protein